MHESSKTGASRVGSITAMGLTLPLAWFVALMPVQSGSGPTTSDPPFHGEALRSRLAPVVEAALRRDQVPGAAIAVVCGGELVLLEGFGFAQLEPPARVDPEATLFRLGSVSKVFTTLALAAELERRRIPFDAPLAPELDGLSIHATRPDAADAWPPLRFVHLFTLTAGFDQIGRDRHASRPEAQLSPRHFLEGRLLQVRPPGAVTCYDTYAITLAGCLLQELADAESFAAALETAVFAPLGMEESFVQVPSERRGELAHGFGLEAGSPVRQPFELYNTLPASSVDATAADVARWMAALLSTDDSDPGAVFGPATRQALRAPQFRNHPALPGFTLGFLEEWWGRLRAIWHGGTMRGYSTRVTLFPEQGLGLFSACNRDGETGPPVGLHEELVAALLQPLTEAGGARRPGDPPDATPERNGAAPLDAAALGRFAGGYADLLFAHTAEDGAGWPWSPFEVAVVERDGVAALEFLGRRWSARSGLEFQAEDGRRAFFRVDAGGRVTHLHAWTQSFVRIGPELLEEMLGPDWREQTGAPLVRRVLDWRPRRARVRPPPLDLPFAAELLGALPGRWRHPGGGESSVVARAGALWIVGAGRADRRLMWQGELDCRVDGNAELLLRFVRAANGTIDQLEFHDDDGSVHRLRREG